MEQESIKKNFAYQSIYQILTVIIPIITAPYISRILGADGVGIYSYTHSIVSYFALAAKLGIQTYGNRTIAIVRDDKEKLNQTFSDLFFIHLLVGIVVLAAYGVYFSAFSSIEYKAITAVQVFYIVAEVLDLSWFFYGLEQFKIIVTRNCAIKIFTVIAIFIFVNDSSDVFVYCAIMALGTAISQSVVWVFVPKYIRFVRPNFKDSVAYLKPLLTFFIPSLAVSVYKVMDKIMLGAMCNTVQVGYYENSEKFITIILGFVTSLGTIMLPRMSSLAEKKDVLQSRRLISLSMKGIMIIVIAMAFGIAGVANVFAPVFFGDEFIACGSLMMGLAISMPFTAFANILRTQYLIPNKHDFIYQASLVSGALINLFVNFVLIGSLGAMGAVVGTIAAEGSVCIIQATFLRRKLPLITYLLGALPYGIFGFIMFILVKMIGDILGTSVMTLVVQVLCGCLIYSSLSLLYVYLKKDELLGMIKNTIQHLRRK